MSYTVALPDGRTVEFPDEVSKDKAAEIIRQQLGGPQKTGLLAAAGKGLEGMLGSTQTAFGAAFGSPEEAAAAALKRQQSSEYADQISLEKAKEAFGRGVLPGIGEVGRQIPLALAEQFPQIAAGLASGAAGAAAGSAVFPGVGTLIGAGVGALAPSLVQAFGSGVERQAAEQQKAGQPLAIDTGAAALAAVPSAALDVASMYIPLGRTLIGKVLGPQVEALLKKGGPQAAEAAERLGKEALYKTVAKGTGVGLAAQAPTEIAQQMLERAQAGLSLTGEDALKEYVDTAYQAGLLAPIGAGGRLADRGAARQEVEAARQATEAEAFKTRQEAEKQAAEALDAQRQTPEYAQEVAQKYAALMEQRRELQAKVRTKVEKDDLIGLADKKDAAREFAELNNSDEFKSTSKEFRRVLPVLRQLEDQQAQEQAQQALGTRTPQDVFLERMGLAEAPQVESAFPEPYAVTAPATPRTAIDDAMSYAQQQIELVNQREFPESLDPKDRPALYAAYLMDTPGLAKQLVDAGEPLPGMRKSESNAVLAGLKLQLSSLGGEISKTRGMRTAEQTAIDEQLRQERAALERMRAAPEYLQGAAQERITDKADTAQRAVLSAQLTAPIQEQRTLGLEAPSTGERTYTQDRTPDQNALAQSIKSVRQRAELTPEETKLLDDIEDNLPQISKDRGFVSEEPRRAVGYRTPEDALRKAPESKIQQTPLAKDVASLLYSLQIGRKDDTLARQISQRLEGYQRGKLSETEAATQLARRGLTEEEQKSLEGTTLGPRGERKIEGTEVGKTIANFAQNAKTSIYVREATDEIQRAVQSELPLADRKGATSVAFGDWKEFQGYLGSQGLQLLRSATADVTNGAYPNIHRAAVQINKMAQRAAGVRSQFDSLIKRRKEMLAGPEADARVAAQLLSEAGKLLENKLVLTDDAFPGNVTRTSVVEHIQSAKQKLNAAERTRDQLLLQFKNNIDTFEGAIQEYEKGRAPTVTAPAKGAEPPTVMIGYEAENVRRRAASQEATKKARDDLKEAVDNLIAHQRWLAAAQKSVNFIDKDTPAPEVAFRKKKLEEVRSTIPRLQKQLATQNAIFMRVVSKGISTPKAKSPVLKDSVFKDFLVEEAKLTDFINAQNKALSGLRLNLYNARTRLNDAYLSFEDAGGLSLQQARNNLLAAEAMDKEVQRVLTATREAAPSPAQEQQAAKEAGALEAKARATQRVVDRLYKREAPPADKETQADREARDAQLRRKEQARLERAEEPVAGPAEEPRGVYAEKPLEERQKEGTPIPREQLFMEARRKIRQEIQDKADKLSALRDMAEDADSTLEERVEATNEFAKLYAATHGKLEKLDARLSNAFNKQKNIIEKLKELRATLTQESVLSENQQKRYKNKPEVLAEKDAAQRAKIQKQIPALFDALNKTTSFISSNRGIERVQVATKAERAEERAAPREIEEVLTPAGERIAQTQTTKRQVGPVVKRGTVPPGQMLTGSEESRAGETTIGTRNQPRETAGSTQRNVALTQKEIQDANRIANEIASDLTKKKTALNAITSQLAFIKANPSKTTEGQAKQKEIAQRLTKQKNILTSEVAKLRAQQEAVVSGEDQQTIALEKEQETATEEDIKKNEEKAPRELDVDALNQLAATATQGPALKEEVDVEDSAAAVMQNISKTTTSDIARAVADKLKLLLGETRVRLVKDLRDQNGNAVYGQAAVDGSLIALDAKYGLNETTALHEGVHAAVERILRMPESQLTDRQRAAKRELEALFDAIKNDDTIVNENAKTSMSEFLSEALSDGALQVQLRAKPWTLKNAWESLKNGILKMLGIDTPKDMLEATLASADALMTKVIRPTEADANIQVVNRPRYAAGLADAGRITDALVADQKSIWQKTKPNLLGLGFRTQFVDKLAPLEKIANTAMEALKGTQMMYYLRMYEQRTNFTSQSISNGVPQLVEKTRKDGRKEWVIESTPGATIKDVVDILTSVSKQAGSPDAANRLFTLYLAAKRAERVGIQALNFGGKITQADLDTALKEIAAVPALEAAFERARDKYNDYNKNLLTFAVQTGSIPKNVAASLLAAKDYIPFYRVREGSAELLIGNETPIRIGSLKDSPHLQELVGGDEAIFDFLTSSVQNTSMLLDMSLKNIATKNAMYELADSNLAKIGRGTGPKNAVDFTVDGKPHYAVIDTDAIGIPSDLLVKGLAGIPTMLPTVTRIMGAPARLLRRAVTASPVYMARQIFRDSVAATMLSGADMTPILSTLRQLGKESELTKRGITGGQVFTGTNEDISRLLSEMQSGRPVWAQAFAKLEAMSMEADAATRRAQYNSYIKQGLSEMEATFMALESMNFNKRGVSPSMHLASTLIPFMNAQIQGLDVMYKAFAGKMPFNERLKLREKMWTRGMVMFGMSMWYAASMQDDEAYKNATPEQKYGNWFVRIPGIEEPIRVPIPFELGYVFKAIPEAIVNTLINEHGGEEATKAFKQIGLQLIPGGTSYGIPQAVKPLIELGLGKSFYTGRDLESAAEKAREPGTRYRENTSELAKQVGEITGVSPIQLEYLISSYTGSMGLALLQTLNFAMPAEGPEKAFKRMSEQPLVGTLFQPNDAGGIINATYERMNEINQIKATFDDYIKTGQKDKAREYLNENAAQLAQASLAGNFREKMGELTAYEKVVRSSTRSAQDKRELLDRVRQLKIKYATSVRAAFDRTTPQ